MNLSDVVSVKRFLEFTEEQKEELYKTLLHLAGVIDEIPKKSLRKTLDISLAVLQYKGEQMNKLHGKSEEIDNPTRKNLLEENKNLRSMLDALEKENRCCANKVKSLTDEIVGLQKRLEDAAKIGEISNEDSFDPLSELDKQEELLRDINIKNKHIKRLLREIEFLQTQNIEQSKIVIDLEVQIQQAKDKILQLSTDITLVDNERKALKETINELKVEISRLKGNVTYLEDDRERSERELKAIIKRLEAKAQLRKKLLLGKDQQLRRLDARLIAKAKNPATISKTNDDLGKDDQITGEKNSQREQQTKNKLQQAIESRDKLILQLENKIKEMTEEMLASTKLMEKLTTEKLEQQQNSHKTRPCCKVIEEALQAANARCQELSSLLERSEEDNFLKSKQAWQAITALDAYERGENGLVKALKKCTSLEQKVLSRNKQIQALVVELNMLNQVSQENILLRKRLNIPDDQIILTKDIVAKDRRKDQIVDRLKLKLRASEEMRLQLKLEKTNLRTELLAWRKNETRQNQECEDKRSGFSTEVGEVFEEVNKECLKEDKAVSCHYKEFKSNPSIENLVTSDLDYIKFEEVVAENDSLRQGMLEILEKLREYDASSEHITIDANILLRLLQVLESPKSNEGTIPADIIAQMNNELQNLRLREKALQEMCRHQATDQTTILETDEISSVESIREDGEIRPNNIDLPLDASEVINCSTRPTTPNKTVDQSLYPIICVDETLQIERIDSDRIRCLQLELVELQVYRQRYEELKVVVSSEMEGLNGMFNESVERITKLQLALTKKCKCYDYLLEDFDRSLTEHRKNEMKHIEENAKLNTKINELLERITELEDLCWENRKNMQYSTDEYLALQRTNTELQSQMAYIVQHILNGKLDPELIVKDLCTDYGIINENLQLDYLTSEEYELLKNDVNDLLQEKSKLSRKCNQLEGLLEVAQEQIRSQQKLLSDLTDNHVNLRHLVADLQTNLEDKLILAKLQRDLNTATSEVDNLKLERDHLKEICRGLECKIEVKNQQTAKLKSDFHQEQRLKDTKLKFLRTSLFALKEKYAKFTPLIFLTNFIFAYTKFTKNMILMETTNEIRITPKLIQTLEEIVFSTFKKFSSENCDESQHLVKLVKAETENRLLEDHLITLKRSNEELQQELIKERVRSAGSEVHWKTVQFLYELNNDIGSEKNQELKTSREDLLTERANRTENSVSRENKVTNTDVSLPVERKLFIETSSNEETRIMGNKSLSPIGSPINHPREIVLETVPGSQVPGEMNRTPTVEDPYSQIEEKEDGYEENEEIEIINLDTEKKLMPEAKHNEEHSKEDIRSGNEIKFEQNIESLFGDKQNEKQIEPTKLKRKCGSSDHALELKSKEVQANEIEQKRFMDALIQTSREVYVSSLSTQTIVITEKKEERLRELHQKLNEAQNIAEERRIQLKETSEDLSIAKREIEELKNQIDKMQKEIEVSRDIPKSSTEKEILQTKTNIIEQKTIQSFHTLLNEKDKSITKYQDLLYAEREQTQKSTLKHNHDIEAFQNALQDLRSNVKIRDMEVQELKAKLKAHMNEHSDERHNAEAKYEGERSGDNSPNEISDEKIEEMFVQDADCVASLQGYPAPTTSTTMNGMYVTVEEKQDTEILKGNVPGPAQIKNPTAEMSVMEDILKNKDGDIFSLKEKLKNLQPQIEKGSTENIKNPDVEHLKILLEEKNRHINDLLSTLDNFHGDQERFMNENANTSAKYISKLTESLARTEATNKIYRAQIAALQQQLSNIDQREKQMKELNRELRNELVKRPIVSIKSELNARVKNENLNKRIQQLELDLEDARMKIQKQNALIESRKVKSNSGVNLWEKQKRWQQAAEKYKARLDETETRLEKNKSLLNTARNAIRRLEKEKHILEAKLAREPPSIASSNIRCCNAPKCPSQYQTSSETPEIYTGCSSQNSSPAHCPSKLKAIVSSHHCFVGVSSQKEINYVLKARNELLQRKIATMELEDKGSNVLTTELEKLQEKLSANEAQNIRLEAKNLQLQLENDVLKQCDTSERLNKRIKHLEDYIIALKEEIAQSEARQEICKCSGIKVNIQTGQSAEQTILSLKNLVEKLRAENKYLKENRRSWGTRSLVDTPKGAKGELNLKPNSDEIDFIKEQLIKKTKLLQKAKILLTRAAAKEKGLKEQVALWKRKCSELQNVPVIDEISE